MKDFRSVFFPYCLARLKDGRYTVLNRSHKPLGFVTRDRVKYEEYPICVKLKGLGPAKARRLSWNASENLEKIYLYDDSCVPTTSPAAMESYLDKLQLLAKVWVM